MRQVCYKYMLHKHGSLVSGTFRKARGMRVTQNLSIREPEYKLGSNSKSMSFTRHVDDATTSQGYPNLDKHG